MTWRSAENYDQMSQWACDVVGAVLSAKPDANLCLATGGSPEGLYAEMVRRKLGTDMRVTKLDEWHGLPDEHTATSEYFLRTRVLGPLAIPEERYLAFDGMAEDPEAECRRIAQLLRPVDLAILGIGRNGHLGLNEPADELIPGPHVAELTLQTRSHGMLATSGSEVTHGLTMGIGNIMRAERVLLLITGPGKGQALAELKRGVVTTRLPASILHLHPRVDVIVGPVTDE
jgi:galactosamine-6-phosphate isomerase